MSRIKIGRKRKAVSPVIAAILLIAISVSAAVVTYSFVLGSVTTTSAQAGTQIRIDTVSFETVDLTGTVTATTATGYTGTITGVKTYTYSIGTAAASTAESSVTRITTDTTIVYTSTPLFSSVRAVVAVSIRNIGTTTAIIQTIQILDSEGNVIGEQVWTADNAIAPGKVRTFLLNPLVGYNFVWNTGTSYTIKAITDTGYVAQASFTSPAG
jgi:flagellin-like protein